MSQNTVGVVLNDSGSVSSNGVEISGSNFYDVTNNIEVLGGAGDDFITNNHFIVNCTSSCTNIIVDQTDGDGGRAPIEIDNDHLENFATGQLYNIDVQAGWANISGSSLGMNGAGTNSVHVANGAVGHISESQILKGVLLDSGSQGVLLDDDMLGALTNNTSAANTVFLNNRGSGAPPNSLSGSLGVGTTPWERLTVAGEVPTATTGSLSVDAGPENIYVQGRYAYMANWTAGELQIVDVSNPTAPVSVGTLATVGPPIAVYVQGRYAYVPVYSSNLLQVIDVSNPTAPVAVGSVTTGTHPQDVYVQGRYAYVANYGSASISIIDVSNPSAPVSVGTVTTGTNPSYISVQGHYLYVVNSTTPKLQVFDISNPASPKAAGSVSVGTNPQKLYVQGSYAYVPNYNDNTLSIIDISNPNSPTTVSTPSTSVDPSYVSVQGRYAYISTYSHDTLQVMDVSNPASAYAVGVVGDGKYSTSIYVQGNYAYAANYYTHNLYIYELGGGYIQQLEAGGIETGTLSVRNNFSADNGVFTGGLTVGGSLNVTGSGSFVSATSTFNTTANIFNITTASSTNSIFSVLGNGNVGIGTTSPGSALSVAGNTSITTTNTTGSAALTVTGALGSNGPTIKLDNTSANFGSNVSLYANGALKNFIGSSGDWTGNSALYDTGIAANTGLGINFYVNGSGNASAVITSGGNVGIGTTSPDTLLAVGSATPSGNVAHFENSTGSCYINPTTTSLSCSSDARLKTNINSLSASSGLAALMQLNPVTYNWKTESATTSPHTGFIAQQVLPILPDLVSQGPDGYYTLNYAGFTPYLVKAMQEIASISDTFEQNLIAWLGNAGNGITDLYATVIHASTGNFSNQLCVGSTCVTPQQFQAMVAAANQSGTGASGTGSSTPPPASDTGAAASSSADSPATPPVLQINGDNPAIVQVGATYTDLGAQSTGPTADLNLDITTYVNGAPMNPVQLDTTQAATDTIAYVATDQSGLTSTTTRTVTIEAPSIVPDDASTTATSSSATSSAQ